MVPRARRKPAVQDRGPVGSPGLCPTVSSCLSLPRSFSSPCDQGNEDAFYTGSPMATTCDLCCRPQPPPKDSPSSAVWFLTRVRNQNNLLFVFLSVKAAFQGDEVKKNTHLDFRWVEKTSFLQKPNSGALAGNHLGLRKPLRLWNPDSGQGR